MQKRDPELTAKIMRKASLGVNKRKIAQDLGISERTVLNHLQAVKSEFDSRTEDGQDPSAAWLDLLIGILAAAGALGAILGGSKFLEEMHKMHHIQIKMEERKE